MRQRLTTRQACEEESAPASTDNQKFRRLRSKDHRDRVLLMINVNNSVRVQIEIKEIKVGFSFI